MPPVTLPCFASRRHDPSCCVGVNSVEKRRPVVAFGKWNSIQEVSCDNGNREWNSVRNAFESGKSLNDRDAKSAILFDSPATCDVVSGDAWHVNILKARILSSLAAVVAFVANSREAHATVGVLSHQHAMCACARSVKASKAIH